MEKRKRNRLDIVIDMLLSIQDKGGKIKPTHLMYQSNLSHKQLKLYLEEMITKEFVGKVATSGYDYVVITDKGRMFLQKLQEIKEFDTTFGL
jgi:predicted transcriptional regulator